MSNRDSENDMFIKKIVYQSDEVTLEGVDFEQVNVLVGVSGAGKTTIMNCLNTLGHIARGGSYPSVSWLIEFIDNKERTVKWSGEFCSTVNYDHNEQMIADLIDESVEIDGVKVVSRDLTNYLYGAARLPALDKTQSALFHLKTEDVIKPVASAFDSTVIISTTDTATVDAHSISLLNPILKNVVADFFAHNANITKLSTMMNIESRTLLYFAHQYDKTRFDDVEYEFTAIFPFIGKILISTHDSVQETGVREAFVIELQTVSGEVIKQQKISSGMLKTLSILCHLYLTEPTTSIVIDEIENSLGVNCLPDILSQLLSSGHQIILSSHHPKIINKIPIKHWLIVNRNGKKVKVSRAVEAGIGKGNHEAFTKLMNSKLYANGVE